MSETQSVSAGARLIEAMGSASASSSARLKAVLAAGTYPDAAHIPALVERCATEPDFYVRDMLTWALTRHSASETVPLLLKQTASEIPQARSQALHTLSKIGDSRGWAAVTPGLLADPDDEVARSAWRAAVVLVPAEEKVALARTLAAQLGRGGRDVQLSLSRALAALGDAAGPALGDAAAHRDEGVRAHALATEHLIRNPDDGFDAAIFEAKRVAALGGMEPEKTGETADDAEPAGDVEHGGGAGPAETADDAERADGAGPAESTGGADADR